MLRAWLAAQGVHRPTAALVERVADESVLGTTARWPASGGGEIRLYRSRMQWVGPDSDDHGAAQRGGTPLTLGSAGSAIGAKGEGRTVVEEERGAPVALRLHRSCSRQVPTWGGELRLRRGLPEELGLPGPLPLNCVVRARAGEDRFQRAPRTPPRRLKKQFQGAGIAPWWRLAPVVCDAEGRLLLVPGLGMDARVAIQPGGWVLEWQAQGSSPP